MEPGYVSYDFIAKGNYLYFSYLTVSLIIRFEFDIPNIFSADFHECLHALLYVYSEQNESIWSELLVDYIAKMDNR